MPVHDWSKVDAGIFHSFLLSWISHLMGAMNRGVLPSVYYALTEKHAGLTIPEVMTPHRGDEPRPKGGAQPSYTSLRRTLTVRRDQGDRLVAIVEIIPPGGSRGWIYERVREAIAAGVHLLMIDVFETERSPLSNEVPLFIEPDTHVLLPLDTTYSAAFRGVPSVFREVHS